jgi:hypothetical protein
LKPFIFSILPAPKVSAEIPNNLKLVSMFSTFPSFLSKIMQIPISPVLSITAVKSLSKLKESENKVLHKNHHKISHATNLSKRKREIQTQMFPLPPPTQDPSKNLRITNQ